MLRIVCVKNLSVAGPVQLFDTCPGASVNTLAVAGFDLRASISYREHPLIDIPYQQIDMILDIEFFKSWHEKYSRGSLRIYHSLTACRARLSPSGILKIFYSYEVDDEFLNVPPDQFSNVGTTIIQNTETEGPIYRRIIDHLMSEGWIDEISGFRYDHWSRVGAGQVGSTFDHAAVNKSWHSVHFILGTDNSNICLLTQNRSIDGVAHSFQTGSSYEIRSGAIQNSRGRFGWQITGAEEEFEIGDILDVATLAMDERQTLDATRDNAVRIAADLKSFLAESRDRGLSDAIDYEVQSEQRLMMIEQLPSMIEPIFRDHWDAGKLYYEHAQKKTLMREAFAVLRQAVSAERERQANRFSRTVTIVALVFTALSFVTTGIALVDYFDPERQIQMKDRLLLLLLSLVPGVLGVVIALVASRSRG